jgi:hypothetical protein
MRTAIGMINGIGISLIMWGILFLLIQIIRWIV